MKIQRAVIACSAILYLSCAHQVPPSGGPDDRTGPRVVSTTPAPAAVNVNTREQLTFTFSEWVAPAAAQKSVSILPPLEGGARIRVSGRRIQIIPARPLEAAMTYHVVITATCTDLRNNPLASPYTLVFSTGPTLDSGKLFGCVIDPERRAAQPFVALFRNAADSAIFGTPDYLTQADSASFFSFEHIHCGAYRVIAFTKQNTGRRLVSAGDGIYSSVSRTIMVSGNGDTCKLFPVTGDTAPPRLAAARAVSSTLVMCRFRSPFDTGPGFSNPSWRVECLDKKGKATGVAKVLWTGPQHGSCALMLADSLALLPYRVVCSYRSVKNNAVVPAADTVRINGVNVRDTTRPALSSCSPASGALPLMPDIRLVFTEPVRLTAPLSLSDSLRDTVKLAADTGWGDTVRLTPQRRLHPGSCYRLVLLRSAGRDLSGNLLKPRDTTDTVGTQIFATIAADDIAISLKGCAPCLGPDKQRKWRFLPLSGGPAEVAADSSGCFRFDSLPAGKGLIGYFTDANGNGVPDRGSLAPWRAPEPSIVLSDTLEARARWEIEGVTIPACVACRPGRAAAAADTAKQAPATR